MKKHLLFLLVGAVLLASCEKNSVSKIPNISLVALMPIDSMRVNVDTPYIVFKFTDGDADIANDNNSAIYNKDSRYEDSGYKKYEFPKIDESILDPKKGIAGECLFIIYPFPTHRDSLHAVLGDTVSYEFYITDKALNESNHIVTNRLLLK